MKKKYWVLLIILIWIVSVDQWTKYSIVSWMPLHHTVPVIEGFFNLTHVRNPGGAFGVLSGVKEGFGSLLFPIFSVLAIGIVLFFFFKTRDDEVLLLVAFSLVLAGAIGNLIDRIRYGEVIDFLDFHFSSFHWPAFNIADSAICVGTGLIVLEILLRDRKGKKKSPMRDLRG